MKNLFKSTALALACFSLAVPASALEILRSPSAPLVQKQDEWKNLTIASGAVALLGLLGKNGTVATLGTVGALYSAYRYEEDRKSSNRKRRSKAELYSHRYLNIDGQQYKRKTVKKRGKTYYQFVRA